MGTIADPVLPPCTSCKGRRELQTLILETVSLWLSGHSTLPIARGPGGRIGLNFYQSSCL
ncbi:multi-sensor hybrid histidine kinase [Rhodovulum sulfidophilum]|uniref:Multi-sensor hybrid histidine kinase n=1 Tax=Rhodovulum sulfidophilum TaxID=35806 RepID=A0A0D6B5H7_RHOSU|nr:multi-sensor hybrid histidine kinase [Rhodovulum sulfidophilum]